MQYVAPCALPRAIATGHIYVWSFVYVGCSTTVQSCAVNSGDKLACSVKNERISVAFRQHGNSMLLWSHTLMMLANTLAASSVSLHPHKFSSTMVWLLRRPSLSACK